MSTQFRYHFRTDFSSMSMHSSASISASISASTFHRKRLPILYFGYNFNTCLMIFFGLRPKLAPGKHFGIPFDTPSDSLWLPLDFLDTLLGTFWTHFGSLSEDRFRTHFWSILETVLGLILELIWSA